jgi:proline iminopeptidase
MTSESSLPGRWCLMRPDGHGICIYQSGNPQGTPVLLLHGGPGGGVNLAHSRFFDRRHTRVVQFDQRGTGQSTPSGCMENNTTEYQVRDIEAIRERLGITSWWVAGGSWGALLGVTYAQSHPNRVRGLLLRSVFLDRRRDIDWLTCGARTLRPHAHQQLVLAIGTEAGILPALYEAVRAWPEPRAVRAVRAWMHYERVLSGLSRQDDTPREPTRTDFLDTRLELHYLVNNFFLRQDQSASQAAQLDGIPGIVLQGEFDLIAPPAAAHHLVRAWHTGRARIVEGAEHSLESPALRSAWRAAIESMIPPPR